MTSAILDNILDQPFAEILSEKYLAYALSTIMSRSLPDVRDGMKPVHRRILYAMAQLNLKPEGMPKKSARVVGDVIGKFHPHGDQSVYDAMVRLAQDFAVRYPMIDGQGNFGNIDGDNAAAMRYTEAKLTDVAMLMLEGIEEDAVDFRGTYDGDSHEPVVLPAAFPNLLANGSSGIAVGMATNIPPHNVYELCEAMERILDHDAGMDEIMQVIKGPDFPTGGILMESHDVIAKAYGEGRGSFRVRAKWEREELKQGQYQIIVTEIPYQIQKSRLVEKIADLINDKKIPLLDDVRDESTEDIRLVLIPKNRSVDADVLMEALFKYSDLESRFSLNMNMLENGITPKVMDLKEALQNWLNHRQVVLVRRSKHRLDKILHRLEVLGGYLIAYLNIDEVIRIIREHDEPKEELMRAFGLSEIQADAVLNMRLRSLRKLEEFEIRKEHDALSIERDEINALLGSESLQWQKIRTQVTDLKIRFGLDTALGARRTMIGDTPVVIDIPNDAMIEKEPVTILISEKGWIKSMKGHNLKIEDMKYKEGDESRFVIEAQTTDKILIFASNGRFYTLGCDSLPAGRGFGEPLSLMLDIPNDTQIINIHIFAPDRKYLVASQSGRGFVVAAPDALAQTKNGKQVLNVEDGNPAYLCLSIAPENDHIALIGQNRKLLIYPLSELPEMARGKGVTLQKYKDGGLSDAKIFALKDSLTFPYGSGTRTVDDLTPWIGARASAGRMPPNGFPRDNRFV
jgi:topoisomerase-4 subunit A